MIQDTDTLGWSIDRRTGWLVDWLVDWLIRLISSESLQLWRTFRKVLVRVELVLEESVEPAESFWVDAQREDSVQIWRLNLLRRRSGTKSPKFSSAQKRCVTWAGDWDQLSVCTWSTEDIQLKWFPASWICSFYRSSAQVDDCELQTGEIRQFRFNPVKCFQQNQAGLDFK